ncbi:MAG: class I SAM-dependent methyltransferase [Verrucomicrobia subdivision 3 bacterium]|nr:class I SAM-dependent methyltransferase [Limisphaerales bacterium]
MNTPIPTQSGPATNATPFDDGALYDLLLGDFDLGLDFYVGLAKAARGPVLDVACGTGRILIPCLKAGVDVEGLDLFPAMLTRLREKASALGFNPTLHQADMAKFRLSRRYALIMIPFNAFPHNLTTDDQLACLQTCREHLQPGGLLAFDTVFPGLHWIGTTSGTRVLEGEIAHPDTGLPVRMWDTRTFERVQQLQHSYNEVEVLDAARKVVATFPSKTTLRWIYKPEMELLLRTAGFARWQILGDFDGRPLEKETDAMIVQAWTEPT